MSARLHVVFDGNCGFCTRCVGWLRRLDRHDRIEVHASQVPGVLERFGLTPEQADASVWALRTDPRSSCARPTHGGPADGGTVHGGSPHGGPTDGGPVQDTSLEALSGARAVAAVLDTALGVHVLERLHRLPLLGRAADAGYRWVAAHRRLFPGVAPWCQQHPGRCGSPEPR